MSKAVNSWLTGKRLAFLEYLVNKEDDRSQKQVAVDLGLAEATLSRWKRAEGFQEALYKLALAHLGERLGRVLDAMEQSAEGGNTQAARLVLEVCGKIKPAGTVQNVINTDVRVKQTLGDITSEADLRRIGDIYAANGQPS